MKRSPNSDPDDILNRLAYHLPRLRRVRRLTDVQLARRAKLPVKIIRNIEQAQVNISVAKLEALTYALDCATEDLLKRPPKAHLRRARQATRVSNAVD